MRKPQPSKRSKIAAMMFYNPEQHRQEQAAYDHAMSQEVQDEIGTSSLRALREVEAREEAKRGLQIQNVAELEQQRREAKHDREMQHAGTPEPAYTAPAHGHPVNDAAKFILAGNARFTVVSNKTGVRFTFRVRQPKDDAPHFVSVLTGPDNTGDYSYVGTYFADGTYRHGKKSKVSSDAPSAKAAAWLMNMLNAPDKLAAQATVYHEGRCGRCGRVLTVPSSVASGIGPECAKQGG